MSREAEEKRVAAALLRVLQVYGPALEASLGPGEAQAVLYAAVQDVWETLQIARPYSPAEMLRREVNRREEDL